MDKETLSNYGWIVICVLVLAVMIALATPFGDFIANGVKSTTQGLFDASQKALNAANVPGLTIEDQEFDVPGTENKEALVPGATFWGYEQYLEESDEWIIVNEPYALTWDELKELGCVTDTEIISLGYDTFISSIVIPEGIVEIPGDAFNRCENLKDVKLPTTLEKIGMCAFMDCESLENITIPQNVSSISYGVFENAISLKNINVDKDNQNYCSVDGVLYSHDMKTLLYYPAGKETDCFVVPNSVNKIESGSFIFCSAKSVVLPDGLTTIEGATFAMCRTETVEIPASVTKIETYAFAFSKLNSIIFKGTVEQWNAIIKEGHSYEAWNSGCNAITVTCNNNETIIIPSN